MLQLAGQTGTEAAESGTSASTWIILGLVAVFVIIVLKLTSRKTGDNDTSVPLPKGTAGLPPGGGANGGAC